MKAYKECIELSQKQGGKLVVGGEEYQHPDSEFAGGNWLKPTIIYHGNNHPEICQEETFAPILRKSIVSHAVRT